SSSGVYCSTPTARSRAMAEQYTPDEEAAAVAWVEFEASAKDINEAEAEFARFLAKVRREAAREALDGLVETLAVNIEFLAFGARDEFRLAMDIAETYRY